MAKMAGGNFWDGFRNGVISSGLNHAVHTGLFGQGIMMASITGRTRHIFGPDAISTSGSFNGSSGVNLGAETGGLLVLRGENAGLYPINDISLGIGTVDVSWGVEITKLYYSGSVANIYSETFYGTRVEANLSFDVGVSVGLNASYAYLPNNEFVIGVGYCVGVGFSATSVAGNVNWGASGANANQIRNAINRELTR